jgi:dTDP-4-dehydrorhamnose reductase
MRLLITGADGRLGSALVQEFADEDVIALTRSDWDITGPPPPLPPIEVVLHAAAWTDVDAAETEVAQAESVNITGTRNVASLGAPVVYFSTDYVFDGEKGDPYVESDAPHPLSVYGRTKLAGEREAGKDAWIVRSSWHFGETGDNFLTTMLRLGAAQDSIHAVDDRRGCPTYVRHLARSVRELLDKTPGIWHVAPSGDCTWAELAEAIFAEARIDCQVIPVPGSAQPRPAPRPRYSALRSERTDAPRLPHWRQGLRECLTQLRDSASTTSETTPDV